MRTPIPASLAPSIGYTEPHTPFQGEGAQHPSLTIEAITLAADQCRDAPSAPSISQTRSGTYGLGMNAAPGTGESSSMRRTEPET